MVIGGIDIYTIKSLFSEVENRKSNTINDVIKKYEKEGSIIYTDVWLGYESLCLIGYIYDKVSQDEYFIDPYTVRDKKNGTP